MRCKLLCGTYNSYTRSLTLTHSRLVNSHTRTHWFAPKQCCTSVAMTKREESGIRHDREWSIRVTFSLTTVPGFLVAYHRCCSKSPGTNTRRRWTGTRTKPLSFLSMICRVVSLRGCQRLIIACCKPTNSDPSLGLYL